jgi:hypothetical protein
MNVALMVRFVSYPALLEETEDMSDEALQPDTIHESIERQSRVGAQVVGGIRTLLPELGSLADARPYEEHFQRDRALRPGVLEAHKEQPEARTNLESFLRVPSATDKFHVRSLT